jgi:hypothetical protein
MLNRRALIFTLLLTAANAWAGWSLVQETREGILYVDRDSAEKTAKGWQLNTSADFHKAQQHQGKNYLSAKALYELDCNAKSIRSLSLDLFAENMGGGGAVHTEQRPGEWLVPDKGSQLEAIWSSMCQ